MVACRAVGDDSGKEHERTATACQPNSTAWPTEGAALCDQAPSSGESTMIHTTALLTVFGALASLSLFGGSQVTSESSPALVGAAQPLAMNAAALAAPIALPAAQTPVHLRTADYFTILSKSGISTTGATSVVGNMGVSPIDSTAITGFGLTMDPSNVFSTSSLVTGKVLAADYVARSARMLNRAVRAMEVAYTDAAGRTLPDYTELGAGNIGGMTLVPGLYKWGTGVLIPSNGVTLSGNASDVWIFQIAQNLDVADAAVVTLSGGALAERVFWQVAGQTTLGTTSDFSGIILCQTAIVLNTGATLHGKAMSQTAVTLDSGTVVR